jgi:hypothetical protein
MVSIVSDDRDIERSLEKNVMLAENAGAVLNEGLVIKFVDGSLSVEAPTVNVGEVLIRLPLECVLPVELFQLSVAGDAIEIRSHEAALSSHCVGLMEALLDLYNLAGKLARHRLTSPWTLIASHPELLPDLALRLPNDLSLMFEKFKQSADIDELMLDSFLHSRTFNYRENENLPPFPMLLPIIDFLNHHLQGSPVQLDDSSINDGFLTIAKSSPVLGAGNECFAFYGLNDRFDTWVSYGFIDETAPFVRSVPMRIDLTEFGTLQLANFVKIRSRDDLPQEVRDLHLFIPEVLARKGNYMEVTSLLLPPPQIPDALRRALAFLIEEMGPAHPRQRELVVNAEAQIVGANVNYYSNLLAALQSLTLRNPHHAPILANFIRMCELQLARIRDYARYARG